jgi:Mg-chelatase subunit ChlD
MTRRALVVLGAFAVAATCAASTLAASAPIRITEAGGASFPGRSYVLSLPRAMQLQQGVVSVTENGQDVDSLLVTSAGEIKSSQRFGVVLAIDASISMRGKAIKAAMSAARTLAAQRNNNQLLGLVVFNKEPTVVLPLTNDPTKIEQALLREPPLSPGTQIYDAVENAVSMLGNARVEAGSVVVLSDGADTGSRIAEAQAAAHARNAHVRVFTVGLKSRFFKGSPLKKLAHDVGGSYILARNAAALSGIYGTLGSKFANEYLIRYRSLAKAGVRVDVRVKVKGLAGVATTAYDTPKLGLAPPLDVDDHGDGGRPPRRRAGRNRRVLAALRTETGNRQTSHGRIRQCSARASRPGAADRAADRKGAGRDRVAPAE